MDLLHKINLGNTTIAVGRHYHPEHLPEEPLSAEEKRIVEPLSPRKKLEWISSRELLYQIAGSTKRLACLYDDFGKPILPGSERHISVSHSDHYCAAMISDEPCGVDIQLYTHTVARIADRFLTADELSRSKHAANAHRHLHILWGAKECIYKAYGRRKLGFREHISIPVVDERNGTGTGEIHFEGLHLSYEIHFRFLPETAWVFCIQRPV